MIYISFKVACRSCYQTDGITRIYNLQNASKEEFLKKTEYSVMKTIEKWRLEDEHSCPFCGSTNNEVMDVEIDNEKLYDFKELGIFYGRFLLALHIEKDNNVLNLIPGGSRELVTQFAKEAIDITISTIKERPDELFEGKSQGHFFICVSGGLNVHNSQPETNIQRLRHAGLTKYEIIYKISDYAHHLFPDIV